MDIDELKKIADSLKPVDPQVCGIVCHENVVMALKKNASREAASTFLGNDFTGFFGVPVVVDNDMQADKVEVYKDPKFFDFRVAMINVRKLRANKEDV